MIRPSYTLLETAEQYDVKDRSLTRAQDCRAVESIVRDAFDGEDKPSESMPN